VVGTPSPPVYRPKTSQQRDPVVYTSSSAVAHVAAVVDLIDKISELLLDCRLSSNGHLDLALELESLQMTMTLTRFVLQMYENQPLGQSLANTITPGIQECVFVLQELLDSIDDTWLDVSISSVGGFCLRIWRAWLDGDEFSLLRKKLSDSRQPLQGLLTALRSYVSFVFIFDVEII
jgi:hypothetical protein